MFIIRFENSARSLIFARAFSLLLSLAGPSLAQTGEGEKYNSVLSHSAFIKVYPKERQISVIDTFVVVSSVSEIPLRLSREFQLDGGRLNGVVTIPARQDALVQIRDVNRDTNTIILEYHGAIPKTDMTQSFDSSVILREEDVLPQGSHEYQNARITMQVPAGWEAIAPGALLAKTSKNDSTESVWNCEGPIPSLGWFVAGIFSVTNTTSGGVEISTYRTTADTGKEWPTTNSKILSIAKNALQVYNGKYGMYRFPRLAIVEVEDFLAGKSVVAAAMPAAILAKKSAFTTPDTFNSVTEVLPHEIAHQWFPQTIFIDDEDAAILSEGMCEYSARLYHETMGDTSVRDNLKNHPLLRSLLIRAQQQTEVPLQQKADLRAIPTQYLKAYYFHHMLRTVIGDTAFMKLLNDYTRTYRLKKATLADYKQLAEQYSGKKLDWFFEQWVKKTGIPRLKLYNVKTALENGTWKTKGNVRVVGYAQFTVSVKVEARNEKESVEKDVWLGVDSSGKYRNDVSFELVTNEKPTEALLNPRGDALLTRKLPPRLSDLREPSDAVMIIGSHGKCDSLWSIARRDSAAMDAGGWFVKMITDTASSLVNVQRERVFLYGTKEQNSIVEKFTENFPIIIRNDSAFYQGKAFSGDSVGVIQIIENPFFPNGLAGWIVPLGKHSLTALLPFPDSYVVFKGISHESEGSWEIEDEEYTVKLK